MKKQFIILLLLIIGISSTSVFSQSAIFQSTTGSTGGLLRPSDVAVDASGNFHIVDRDNDRIAVFSSAGVYLREYGGFGFGNGLMSRPRGIVIHSNGNAIVADWGNNYIQVFNAATGVYQFQIASSGNNPGQLNTPNFIAIDASGDIYVTEDSGHRVSKFSATGTYISLFGSSGTGNGQFNMPNGIAIDGSGNIYVADRMNHRVQKFNSSGVYQSQFGNMGTGNGQFNEPTGIGIDANDNVYVSDFGNDRIQVFNSSGTYLFQFGTEGTGNLQFDQPMGIKFDSNGSILITERDNHRVQKDFVYITNPTITVATTGSSTVIEQNTNSLTYRFSRTQSNVPSFTVNFSISGTAADSDYTVTTGGTGSVTYNSGTNTGTITFPEGQSTVDLPVVIANDVLVEGDETVIVNVSAASGYTNGNPASATGTIDDNDFPTVTSITLADVNPTSATTLNFTVIFSHTVTGVNAGDFTVDGTGVTASIGTISGTTNTYNVQVTSVSGNGTLSIDLIDDNSITTNMQPLGGNAANDGDFTNGAEYDIDQTAPTTVSFIRKTPANEITNADQLTFLATFSEAVTGIDVSDFEAMSTTASVSIISSTTNTACIQLSGGDLANLTGTVGLNLAMTPTIQDLTGNDLPNTEPATDETYNVNNTNPMTVSFSPMDDAMGVTITTDLVITFDKTIQKGTGNILIKRLSDDTVFETIDVTTGQVAVSGTMATINPSVDLDQATAYYIEIANTCFEDAVGNQFAGISGNSTWNFETFIPSIGIVLQSATTLSENSGTNFVYRFSRTGSTTQDLTINYSVGGTADNNDFMVTTDANTTYATGTKTGTIKILAGNAFADLTIVLSNDSTVEISETIIVTIEAP